MASPPCDGFSLLLAIGIFTMEAQLKTKKTKNTPFFCAPLWAFSKYHSNSVTYSSGRLLKDLIKRWVGGKVEGEQTVNGKQRLWKTRSKMFFFLEIVVF